MIAAATVKIPTTTAPLLLTGNNIEVLQSLPEKCVQCIVTSPPYFRLRTYVGGNAGEHGREQTPDEYVAQQVVVGRELRRVLRDDGIYWLNIDDSYGDDGMMGVPWRVALALMADGWVLRCDPIWFKTRHKPSSVKNRPVRNHEYIFMFTKGPTYYTDMVGVREPLTESSLRRYENAVAHGEHFDPTKHKTDETGVAESSMRILLSGAKGVMEKRSRSIRSIWPMSTSNYKGKHFAVFPEELPRKCIKMSTSEKGACSVCGTPWIRVWERIAGPDANDNCRVCAKPRKNHLASTKWDEQINADSDGDDHPGDDGAIWCAEYKTTGWKPTCAHPDAPVQPCIVLDHYAGSGTTVAVAHELGRGSIGIDLNPENLPLQQERVGPPNLSDRW